MNTHFEYIQVWTQIGLSISDSIWNAVPLVKLSKKIKNPVLRIYMTLKIKKSRKIGFFTSVQKAGRKGQIERHFLVGKPNAQIQAPIGKIAKVFIWEVERRVFL